MKTAGYWINRITEPDRVILTPAQISALNLKISRELNLREDLRLLPVEFDGRVLAKSLAGEWEKFSGREYYFADGTRTEQEFWDSILDNMRFEAIPDRGRIRFGFVARYADQRLLPSASLVSAKALDIDFDELQNSSFDTGTPLAVMHESRDGLWCFAVTPSSSGWILKEKIVFCTRDQLFAYLDKPDRCVVTGAKADIFLDPGLTRHYGYCRMGSSFPMIADGQAVEIRIPGKDENGAFSELPAYISRQDLNPGFLAYTQRAILTQAFRLINAPYGWGGMHGEQDCSSFIQQVFAVCGIDLPRNSGSQARIGRDEGSIGKAVPAISLLSMKGHILLYLGESGGSPYAIHEVWAYREPAGQGDTVRVINRVAVTGLNLGEGSQKGSWLKRIISIKTLDN